MRCQPKRERMNSLIETGRATEVIVQRPLELPMTMLKTTRTKTRTMKKLSARLIYASHIVERRSILRARWVRLFLSRRLNHRRAKRLHGTAFARWVDNLGTRGPDRYGKPREAQIVRTRGQFVRDISLRLVRSVIQRLPQCVLDLHGAAVQSQQLKFPREHRRLMSTRSFRVQVT